MKYIEYDSEYAFWGVFDSETGFCYASFFSQEAAIKYLEGV